MPGRQHGSGLILSSARRTQFLIALAWLSCLWLWPATTPLAAAEDERGFLDRVYRDDAGEHKYVLFVPESYTPDKSWPIILYLHGAGERGDDGVLQSQIGMGPYVKARGESFSFLVLFPQCEDVGGRALTGWLADTPDTQRALKILESVESQYNVDPNQRVLTGWSMGGYGAWSIAAAAPDRWAALIPVAGGGNAEWAPKLRDIPIWAFHGVDDAAVQPEVTQQMVAAVKQAGGDPRYTEVAGAGHDVWKNVYSNDALYAWMRAPEGAGRAPLLAKPGQRPPTAADTSQPFVPAVDMPNALYVHLGNDALKAISDAVPKIVSADLLTGRIGDIHETTRTEGRTFAVRFTRISYRGQLARVHAVAYKKDRLNIQLGLRNVVLTIGTTYVRGSGRSAVAGPINVVMGHRRPVWLSLDVTPYVEARKLKLQLRSTRFDLPGDNWYVSSPSGVSTQGLGMTRERVSSGLVSGLYGQRARIENEVRSIVPTLIPRLEEELSPDQATDFVASVWPLPVYRPRVRVWPQRVVTDQKGISLVMGVTAAAADPRRAPQQPRNVPVAADDAFDHLSRGAGVTVGLAANILRPLTDMLVRADMARIHVLDIPEKAFAPLADSAALTEVIPDLATRPEGLEIWSELVLQRPLVVRDVPESLAAVAANVSDAVSSAETTKVEKTVSDDSQPGNVDSAAADPDGSDSPANENESPRKTETETDAPQPQRLLFEIPELAVSLATRSGPQTATWAPLAEFQIAISQEVVATMHRPNYGQRQLSIEWSGDPRIQVTGRFAAEYQPKDSRLNVDAMRRLFLRGWQAWTQSEPVSDVTVNDLDFGYSKLRLVDLKWRNPFLLARFGPPGVKISNESDEPLVYEVKGPYSGWGGPHTLQPERSHEYSVAVPLLFRRKIDSGYRMFTLPIGSHSEFRAPTEGEGPSGLYRARTD